MTFFDKVKKVKTKSNSVQIVSSHLVIKHRLTFCIYCSCFFNESDLRYCNPSLKLLQQKQNEMNLKVPNVYRDQKSRKKQTGKAGQTGFMAATICHHVPPRPPRVYFTGSLWMSWSSCLEKTCFGSFQSPQGNVQFDLYGVGLYRYNTTLTPLMEVLQLAANAISDHK